MSSEALLFKRFGKVFAKGEGIYRQGDWPERMFVVNSGRVQLSRSSKRGERIVDVCHKGEFFGEISLLRGKPHSENAIALEDTKLLMFDKKTFESMLRSNADIVLRLMRKMIAKLAELDDALETLLWTDELGRVVHALSRRSLDLRRIAEVLGSEDEQGIPVAAVSDLTGLDERSLTPMLTKLSDAGALQFDHGTIVRVDSRILEEVLLYVELKNRYRGLD